MEMLLVGVLAGALRLQFSPPIKGMPSTVRYDRREGASNVRVCVREAHRSSPLVTASTAVAPRLEATVTRRATVESEVQTVASAALTPCRVTTERSAEPKLAPCMDTRTEPVAGGVGSFEAAERPRMIKGEDLAQGRYLQGEGGGDRQHPVMAPRAQRGAKCI